MKKRMLLILLLSLPSLLVAGVIATYTTYPLHLESYNSIYLDTYEGTGTNHYQGCMAMHMGRYAIDTQGETVTNFALISNISSEFELYGPTKNNVTVDVAIGFHPVAIVRYETQLYNSNLNQGYKNPINPTNTSMTGEIIIDFYLVSYEPDSIFIENVQYAHTKGSFGNFSISFSSDGNDFWNASLTPVSGENNLPIPEQPYLISGSTVPEEGVPFGDPTEQVLYSFAIFNNHESFDITKAFGLDETFIATAQVTLEYADPTKLYAVTLTFTNQTNSDTFMMTHENPSVDQTIGYKLSFNGYTIDPGDSVDWNGLSEGSSNKDIKVTQIKKSDVDKLLEGLYSDTITVNLTPKDSV
ncbi:MAG: hypothetical protein GX315_02620 [Spirochaetales bacterium]|nr:hypothetical protein [Spirochaetales bacterium]